MSRLARNLEKLKLKDLAEKNEGVEPIVEEAPEDSRKILMVRTESVKHLPFDQSQELKVSECVCVCVGERFHSLPSGNLS